MLKNHDAIFRAGISQTPRRGGGDLRGCPQANELEDGYEFLFPGSEEWVTKLTEFIVFESSCCPFFTFALDFELEGGQIRLRIRGPEGAKDIAAEMLANRTR